MTNRTVLFFLLCLIHLPLWAADYPLSADVRDTTYDHSWYIGATIGDLHYKQSNLEDFGLKDYRLIVGKQFGRVFAAEMHVGTGSDDTQNIFGIPTTLSVDNYVAGFLRANLTFTSEDWDYNRFRLYGLLGGTRIETTSSDPVVTRSGVQNSFSAGVGMEFFFDNVGFQLGYIRYVTNTLNNHDYTLDSIHLGIIYQFGDSLVDNGR